VPALFLGLSGVLHHLYDRLAKFALKIKKSVERCRRGTKVSNQSNRKYGPQSGLQNVKGMEPPIGTLSHTGTDILSVLCVASFKPKTTSILLGISFTWC
jgi:hypothetical protein